MMVDSNDHDWGKANTMRCAIREEDSTKITTHCMYITYVLVLTGLIVKCAITGPETKEVVPALLLGQIIYTTISNSSSNACE